MIDVQTAFKKAKEYFTNLYASNEDVTVFNVLIEEVTQETVNNIPECWVITVGYNIKKKDLQDKTVITEMMKFQRLPLEDRHYKIIILSPDGGFISMKIRKAEYA
jgi:hypothetical protein